MFAELEGLRLVVHHGDAESNHAIRVFFVLKIGAHHLYVLRVAPLFSPNVTMRSSEAPLVSLA
jgi:adenosine/AMP kinase